LSDAIILSEFQTTDGMISTFPEEFHQTRMRGEEARSVAANAYLAEPSESPSKRDKKEIS
jgi:hypothetical protein